MPGDLQTLSDRPLKVGLLGGSFNPAHEGHLELSLSALSTLGLDEMWWLVTPANPLKDTSIYAPFDDRMNSAKMIAEDPRIKISDFEKKHGLQYTIDTLTALKKHFPGVSFVWTMGADNLRDFHLWRDWRDIAAEMPIAVFDRPGYKSDALESVAAKELAHFRIDLKAAKTLAGTPPVAWVFVNETNNPMSSTQLRAQSIDP